MGEAKQKEEKKPEEKQEEKKEESPEEKKEEKAEENKEEVKPPSPPPPTILFVDLHCVGCAKKIERSIMKCRGVEGVVIDMVQNQVTVKGIVDPQAICSRVQKKTTRQAKVLSPLPPAEGETAKSDVSPGASGLNAVELKVNMHCEACAQQLRRKILKMRGVQAAETHLSSGKVKVTGTMNAESLVDYIYHRTGKLATIVPQPPKEEEKKEGEGEKKEDAEKPAEEKKEEGKEEKKEEDKGEKKEEEKQEEKAEGGDGGGGGSEEKREGEVITTNSYSVDEDMAKKMMYWRPVYVIERLPPPQLFSDENPNACCIS